MQAFKDLRGMINYSDGGVISKVVFKGEANQVTLFCMAEGTDISEHTSSMEGFVYVIDGDGVFHLESADIPMKPGVLIHMNKNARHSLKAVKNTSFLLFLTD